MAAHVLVVANVTAASTDLIQAIKDRAEKGPIDVTLLMPGQGPGLAGREAVRGRLDEALATYRAAGIDADGVCGDANPFGVAQDGAGDQEEEQRRLEDPYQLGRDAGLDLHRTRARP